MSIDALDGEVFVGVTSAANGGAAHEHDWVKGPGSYGLSSGGILGSSDCSHHTASDGCEGGYSKKPVSKPWSAGDTITVLLHMDAGADTGSISFLINNPLEQVWHS